MSAVLPPEFEQLINLQRLSRERVLQLPRMSLDAYKLVAQQVSQGTYNTRQLKNILYIISCFVIGRSEVRSVYVSILSGLLNHGDEAIRDSAANGLVWLFGYRTIPRNFVSTSELGNIESILRSIPLASFGHEAARQVENALHSTLPDDSAPTME